MATTMAGPKPSPVGTWQSPITSELITGKSKALGSPYIDTNGTVYWAEGRPTEGGRQVVVRRNADGSAEDVTPGVESGLNVRTRVHEYGGGAYWFGDGELFFVNFGDQRLYRQQLYPSVGAPVPVSDEGGALRFADGVWDGERGRVVCVVEDHSADGAEASNYIAAVDPSSGSVTKLVGGKDFYSYPRLSKDGRVLAWVQWDHPNMPWDSTELMAAEIQADGSLAAARKVAGGEGISVTQPVWSARGGLYYVSDESDWWNIYYEEAPGKSKCVCVAPGCEFGSPQWVFGISQYSELPDGSLLATHFSTKSPGTLLALVDPLSGTMTQLDPHYTTIGGVNIREVAGKLLLATSGSSPTSPTALVTLTVDSVDELAAAMSRWRVIATSTDLEVDEGYLSVPESIEFATENGLTAFMVYYPPKNKDYSLPAGEKPPLLVQIHGGPTSRAGSGFSLGKQFWTSRGFAIADINYGGSTGFGRQYRQRLQGNWGVVDVDDCCNAAKHLVQQGLVDAQRLTITGGSAGGYTTLACMVFRDVFSAGTSHYGVADCELLAQETHKFESRYLDGLMGPYPQAKELYKARSPINSLDKVNKPIMFFQGDEDKVVPPNQAEIMYEKLKASGLPTGLVMFKGEQHGFRKAENIRTALEGEFFFYAKALGFPFDMSPDLTPPEIVNLPAA